MPNQLSWDSVSGAIRERVDLFLNKLDEDVKAPIESVYLVGAAARDEFDPKNPEITLLLVFESLQSSVLEGIAGLGRTLGRKGFRAPIVLTMDYIHGAQDVFPVEFLDLKYNHIHLRGREVLEGVQIDPGHLRLQCERELRSWRLRLRQGLLRAAGDDRWMAAWFDNAVADIFLVLRGMLHLLGDDSQAGNTETAVRLTDLTDIDLSAFVEVWELGKSGKKPEGDGIRTLFGRWEETLLALVKKVDALEV